MNKMKLLPNDAPQGSALTAVAANGTHAKKAAAEKIEKDVVRRFQDVLGVVAAAKRATSTKGTATTAAAQPRPGLAAPSSRADGPESRKTTDTDAPDDASAADEPDQPSHAAVSAATSDPLRALLNAISVRTAVEREPSGAPAGTAETPPPAASTTTRKQEATPSAGAKAGGPHAAGGGAAAAARPAADARPSLDMPDAAAAGPDRARELLPSDQDQATSRRVEIRAPVTPKVEVLDRQTHFAPVTTPATLQQVSDAVVADVTSAAQSASPSSRATPAATASGAPPVRILTIRLDPPSLGELTVKMRLQGNNLELHLTATEHGTSQMLQQNRELLHDLIRESGYVADIASVQQAGPDAAAPAGASAQPGQNDGRDSSSRRGDYAAGQGADPDRAGAQHGRQERPPWNGRGAQGATPDDSVYDSRRGVFL